MSDLLLPPSAKATDDEFPGVPCPVQSGPVVTPHGVAMIAIPCSRKCPWFLGVGDAGEPLCSVFVLGKAAMAR